MLHRCPRMTRRPAYRGPMLQFTRVTCRAGGRSRALSHARPPECAFHFPIRRIGKPGGSSLLRPARCRNSCSVSIAPLSKPLARDGAPHDVGQLTVLRLCFDSVAAVAGASPGGGLGCPASPDAQKRSVEVMAMDRSNRMVVSADPREPRQAGVRAVGPDGQSVGKFTCLVVGHDWMPNGIWPWRVRGRWLGTSPDWQRCFRCNRWELLP